MTSFFTKKKAKLFEALQNQKRIFWFCLPYKRISLFPHFQSFSLWIFKMPVRSSRVVPALRGVPPSGTKCAPPGTRVARQNLSHSTPAPTQIYIASLNASTNLAAKR